MRRAIAAYSSPFGSCRHHRMRIAQCPRKTRMPYGRRSFSPRIWVYLVFCGQVAVSPALRVLISGPLCPPLIRLWAPSMANMAMPRNTGKVSHRAPVCTCPQHHRLRTRGWCGYRGRMTAQPRTACVAIGSRSFGPEQGALREEQGKGKGKKNFAPCRIC